MADDPTSDDDPLADDALAPEERSTGVDEGATARYHDADAVPASAPTADLHWRARLLELVPSPARATRYLVAIAIAVLWLVPFLGLAMASFRPLTEIIQGWWHVEGMTITFENYERAWNYSTAPLGRALWNTTLVTVPAVLVVMLLGAMAAYPFARFDFPLKTPLFFLILLVMAAPAELVAMGNYNALREMGLFDTYMGLILVHIGWGLGWVMLFLRNFLLGIPEELEEAARIDGASRFQIFRTVILPLSAPALVSVAVIQFTWVWNAFFFPLVFMRSPELYVAPQVLPLMRGRIQVDWGLVAAASVLTMVVPVLLFLVLQRYYKRGMIGAVAD